MPADNDIQQCDYQNYARYIHEARARLDEYRGIGSTVGQQHARDSRPHCSSNTLAYASLKVAAYDSPHSNHNNLRVTAAAEQGCTVGTKETGNGSPNDIRQIMNLDSDILQISNTSRDNNYVYVSNDECGMFPTRSGPSFQLEDKLQQLNNECNDAGPLFALHGFCDDQENIEEAYRRITNFYTAVEDGIIKLGADSEQYKALLARASKREENIYALYGVEVYLLSYSIYGPLDDFEKQCVELYRSGTSFYQRIPENQYNVYMTVSQGDAKCTHVQLFVEYMLEFIDNSCQLYLKIKQARVSETVAAANAVPEDCNFEYFDYYELSPVVDTDESYYDLIFERMLPCRRTQSNTYQFICSSASITTNYAGCTVLGRTPEVKTVPSITFVIKKTTKEFIINGGACFDVADVTVSNNIIVRRNTTVGEGDNTYHQRVVEYYVQIKIQNTYCIVLDSRSNNILDIMLIQFLVNYVKLENKYQLFHGRSSVVLEKYDRQAANAEKYSEVKYLISYCCFIIQPELQSASDIIGEFKLYYNDSLLQGPRHSDVTLSLLGENNYKQVIEKGELVFTYIQFYYSNLILNVSIPGAYDYNLFLMDHEKCSEIYRSSIENSSAQLERQELIGKFEDKAVTLSIDEVQQSTMNFDDAVASYQKYIKLATENRQAVFYQQANYIQLELRREEKQVVIHDQMEKRQISVCFSEQQSIDVYCLLLFKLCRVIID